jgi:hypothetical protein
VDVYVVGIGLVGRGGVRGISPLESPGASSAASPSSPSLASAPEVVLDGWAGLVVEFGKWVVVVIVLIAC